MVSRLVFMFRVCPTLATCHCVFARRVNRVTWRNDGIYQAFIARDMLSVVASD